MEAEAREEAEQRKAAAEAKIEQRRAQHERTGGKPGGRDPRAPDPEKAVAEKKAQRNFTDPESRIMPDGGRKGSFVQACNARIAVDSTAQIIVAAEVTQETNDKRQLTPMPRQIALNAGTKPAAVSADAGYFSEEQMTGEQAQGSEPYVATGKQKHGGAVPGESMAATAAEPGSALEQMKQKLRSEAGQAIYKMRKAIVEPVFGQIKEWRGFRRFGLRGLVRVSAEWKLICLTHNLAKLFRSGWNPPNGLKRGGRTL